MAIIVTIAENHKGLSESRHCAAIIEAPEVILCSHQLVKSQWNVLDFYLFVKGL
jgi:hypothetical protein